MSFSKFPPCRPFKKLRFTNSGAVVSARGIGPKTGIHFSVTRVGLSLQPRPFFILDRCERSAPQCGVLSWCKNKVRGVFPLARFNPPLFLRQIQFSARLTVFAQRSFKIWCCQCFHGLKTAMHLGHASRCGTLPVYSPQTEGVL